MIHRQRGHTREANENKPEAKYGFHQSYVPEINRMPGQRSIFSYTEIRTNGHDGVQNTAHFIGKLTQ